MLTAIARARSRMNDPTEVPGQTSPLLELSDRDLVALQVERIVLPLATYRHHAPGPRFARRAGRCRSQFAGADHAATTLDADQRVGSKGHPAGPEGQGTADASSLAPSTPHLPWTPTSASARKGIAWKPSAQANLDPATSGILLTAIARARSWMNDLTEGRVSSFEAIARSENKVERHIRHLAPLAFVSPRIVEAIANGSAPADLTVTMLARALPHGWAAQEHKFGIT